ncbi:MULTISPECIES: LytTR family transcriptional regulator DNA-binding domain-containing protein [Bacteroidaceae]|uniref:LytTR family transcriptional regulator DNA-binding domain-containing protein n=1 Tax=Bacteroidaceae TaxID=815 RepID=UPI0025E631B7|nr:MULTISPECIES: LytTR family transcriptional regulator DNA-binding domain-containing protein [Bacteroidaceae]
MRVHKSFVVPVHRIASYTSKEVILYNRTRIPVGRSYSKCLKDKKQRQCKILTLPLVT